MRNSVKNRLMSWLKRKIWPSRKPSPLVRKLARALQVFILTILCFFVCWRTLIYWQVSRQFAQIRSAGFPASGAELNTWRPVVPENENGALVMTQAFALIRTFPDHRSNLVDQINILHRTNTWTAEMQTLAEAYVETNRPALVKAQEALRMGRFQYPADFSFGPATELPHLKDLKTLARIASLDAILNAQQGQGTAWTEDVLFQIQVARSLEGEPTILSYLVRDAILQMAVRTIERDLSRATPDDPGCKLLQTALARETATNLLQTAFVGERAMAIPFFRLSRQEIENLTHSEEKEDTRKPRRYSGKPDQFLRLSGLFERDLNFYLATMGKAISKSALPTPQRLALTNYLGSANAVAGKRLYIFSSMFLPAYSKVVLRDTSNEALCAIAETALAIERFRLAQNRLPATLKELAPEFLDQIPQDPFSGTEVRYKLLKPGYAVYSVGADGSDDAGREPPSRKKSTDKSTYDITFIVER